MRTLLQKRGPLAWLLLAAIVSGAAILVWKVAVLDAPPQGAAFVASGQGQGAPSSTITPFGRGNQLMAPAG